MKKVMLLVLLTLLVLPLWGCVISPYPYHIREYHYRNPHPRGYYNYPHRHWPYYRNHWNRPGYYND